MSQEDNTNKSARELELEKDNAALRLALEECLSIADSRYSSDTHDDLLDEMWQIVSITRDALKGGAS